MPYPITLFEKSSHDRTLFDCGEPSLNNYLQRILSQDSSKDVSCAYMMLDGKQVIGYYTLHADSVNRSECTEKTKKQVRYSSIPAFVIGRLAIDNKYQGQKLGAYLLSDALKRCLLLSSQIAARYVVVDALDNKAKAFYEKYGFIVVDHSSLKLLMPMSLIKKKLN